MTDDEKFELLDEYYYLGRFPVWIEYHIFETVEKFHGKEFCLTVDIGWAKSESEKAKYQEELRISRDKHNEAIIKEIEKLDKFCEILCTTEKTHKEAENEVYGPDDGFYSECEERMKRILDRLESEKREKRKEKLEKKKAKQKYNRIKEKKKMEMNCLYIESKLSKREQEKLLGEDYKRIKVSPFGNGGASYYWVKTRYNESKEHAFFCYLIKAELEKQGIEAVLKPNSTGL